MEGKTPMKKVGMLSFHESLSFGATLQCFALQKTIRDMGYDPEFINFQRRKCNEFNEAQTQPTIKDRIKRSLIIAAVNAQNLRLRGNNELVEKEFNEFKKEFLRIGEEEICSIEAMYNSKFDYDIYVTGSDQVWNPYNSVLQVYGLGFAPSECNTISYAASIGVSEIPESKKLLMFDAIQKVRHISCREYEGSAALSDLLKRNIETVLDPTLLLSKNVWKDYRVSLNLPEKYVLCFFLGSLDYPRKVAYEIAKRNGCNLLVIPGSPKDVFSKGKIVRGCGPRQFLELFYNASFICTDSFHGTAFALNFNKPFYSFCRRGYNAKTSFISRIRDLLESVGLSDRLIYPNSVVDYGVTDLDYVKANELLENERSKSLVYLRRALED